MGGEIQQLKAGGVYPQLQVLPVRVHKRLLHSTLPVAEADDLHVGEAASDRETSVLQHEMMTMTMISVTVEKGTVIDNTPST